MVLNLDDIPPDVLGSTIIETLKSHPNPKEIEMIQIQHRFKLLSLPNDIGYFKNVCTLMLSDNALTELPWSLVYLKELSVLDISYNMFRTFPHVITYLKKLRSLNISGNENIRGIPDSILQLENLETLEMGGIPKLHPDILALEGKGVKHIFEKLRSRCSRNNLWKEGYVPSLMYLCMETIIQTQVDYVNLEVIPTRMKSYINQTDEDYSKNVNVGKCSRCKKYFSTTAYFDQHLC
jgi:hypothetical protein